MRILSKEKCFRYEGGIYLGYNEKILEARKHIDQKEYDAAILILESIIAEEPIKDVEDNQYYYHTFTEAAEQWIYNAVYQPSKPNHSPESNLSVVYYHLAWIYNEKKEYDKVMECANQSLLWNPVNVLSMFELALAYQYKGELEKYKEEINRAYKFIFTEAGMARYYADLGIYYFEKNMLSLANALFTNSTYFYKTNYAIDYLNRIAQRENRLSRKSSNEEIKSLFSEYHIGLSFDNFLYQTLYNKYAEIIKNKPDSDDFYYISRILYNMTLNKYFMTYRELKNEALMLQLKVPDIWHVMNTEEVQKLKEERKNNSYILACVDNRNRIITFAYNGECTLDTFQEKVQENIDRWSNNNWVVLGKYFSEERKDVMHVIIENDAHTSRWFESFVVVNNRLVNVQWGVSASGTGEDTYHSFQDSFEMMAVLSLRSYIPEEQNANVVNNNVTQNQTQNQEQTQIQNQGQSQLNIDTDTTEASEKLHLKAFSQEIEGYPTFTFYFPEDIGEYVKVNSNVFEIKEGNVQKIRVMISKCDSAENLEADARRWIEKNKEDAKLEEVNYKKESINGIPLEVYELKYTEHADWPHKIYKIGFVNNTRITISGWMVNNKGKVINQAFERLK